MLEKEYGLVKNFQRADEGVPVAIEWLSSLDDAAMHQLQSGRSRMVNDHCDVCEYAVRILERAGNA